MRWCPSARNDEGAELFGAFAGDDERVRWFPEPLPVDGASRDWLAAEGGETRFRFAAPCVTTRCSRWSDAAVGRSPSTQREAPPTGVEPGGCVSGCEVGAGLAALAGDRTRYRAREW